MPRKEEASLAVWTLRIAKAAEADGDIGVVRRQRAFRSAVVGRPVGVVGPGARIDMVVD